MTVTTLPTPLSPSDRAAIAGLYVAAFAPSDLASDLAWLENAPRSHLLAAHDGDTLVGFKWANQRRPHELHSNLGVVAPSHRRRGIARALLRAQHAWAAEQGFARVTTNTYGHFGPMLVLNLAEGFELVGLRRTPRGLKLLLERDLSQPVEPLHPLPTPQVRRLVVQGRDALAAALTVGFEVTGMNDDGFVLTPRTSKGPAIDSQGRSR